LKLLVIIFQILYFDFSLAEHDDDENSVELLHLFGTATPLGIVSPFIRTNFPTNTLPYYVYSIGRKYDPHSGQSSCIDLLGMILIRALNFTVICHPVLRVVFFARKRSLFFTLGDVSAPFFGSGKYCN
jgi:hypothetical protein